VVLTKHELHAKTEPKVTEIQDSIPIIRMTNSLIGIGLIQLKFKLPFFHLVSKNGISRGQTMETEMAIHGIVF